MIAFKILPKNYLSEFGEFEAWAAGTNALPSGWLAATACTYIADLTNKKYGSYGLALVNGTQDGGGIYCTIPDGSDYQGRTFKLGFWARAATTQPFILLDDGVSVSTAHLTTLNAWEEITITKKLDMNATQIKVGLYSPELNSTSYFDSGVLCEGENLFTNLIDDNIAIGKYSPALNLDNEEYQIAGKDEVYVPQSKLKSLSLKMEGSVIGTDFASCRTHFDNLLRSVMAWQKTEKRNLYIYDDRVLEVFLKNFDWNYLNSLKMIKFGLSFLAPNATTHSIGKYRNTQAVSAGTAEFNFAYGGNADCLPKISFIAGGSDITTCSLQNLTTGESFGYVGTIPANVVLDVDCDLGVVKNSGIDKIADFTGDFLRLVRGTNYFKFAGSECTIRIDWYDRWF